MTAMAFTDLKTVGSMLERVASTDSVSVARVVQTEAPRGAAQHFLAAMDKAASDKAVVVAQMQQTNAPDGKVVAAPSSAAAEANADAQDRAGGAGKVVGSSSTQKKAANGDAILDGLQKLRGVFDVQERHIATLTSKPMTDINKALSIQMELMNFTVLVDVASKLTGQSTQAIETLLKGQ